MFKKILKALDDALYPKYIKCIICNDDLREDNAYQICEKCVMEHNNLFSKAHKCFSCGNMIESGNFCDVCQTQPRAFDFVASPYNYLPPISTFIKQMKYEKHTYLANILAKPMSVEIAKRQFTPDLIIPVPLHEDRQIQRGYNQSQLLADIVGNDLGLEVNNTALKRIRATEYQKDKTRAERMENVKDAFAVIDKSAVKNKNVLLIDDVVTTGETANECSKVLKKAGCKAIFLLTIAHPLYVESIKFEEKQIFPAKTFVKSSKVLYNTKNKLKERKLK